MKIDQVMPHYNFSETHSIHLSVDPVTADLAFRQLKVGQIRLLIPLMWIRILPAKILGTEIPDLNPNIKLFQTFKNMSFRTFIDLPGQEYVFGEVSKPWKLKGDINHGSVTTTEDMLGFNEPGYVKIAANFMYSSQPNGTVVTTHTRIQATSDDALRRFRFYWWLIRIPSGLIRRSMLAALKRSLPRNTGI